MKHDPEKSRTLHALAAEAMAILADDKSEDARTVVSYYRSCLVGAHRAAQQLLAFAIGQQRHDIDRSQWQ